MRAYRKIIILAFAAAAVLPGAASSRTAMDMDTGGGDRDAGSALTIPKAPGHLECVPYARSTSGIQIYGDAWTWWSQARGRYATGSDPRVGAVMAIKPFNNSKLGHVATVSRIVDSRTVLLSHANWSVPGEIERNVTALDVSPENDWSEVRIWYGPSRGLGTTHWPVSGFIYNAKPGAKPGAKSGAKPGAKLPRPRDIGEVRLASAEQAPARKKGRRSDPIGAIIAGNF